MIRAIHSVKFSIALSIAERATDAQDAKGVEA